MRSPLLLAFFPTDALGACLLASGRRALRFGRTAGRVRPALFTFLATARLASLAVDPSFAIVLAEPVAQIAHLSRVAPVFSANLAALYECARRISRRPDFVARLDLAIAGVLLGRRLFLGWH